MCTEDDEYRGYHIPKGSIVIGNAWSILHNPAEYPNPEAFIPERFLKDGEINPDVRDPATAAFGFGRRVCPASAMALSSMYSVISCVLHTYSISHALDADGKPIPVSVEMSTGLISQPSPIAYHIQPRSAAATLIMNDMTDF
ncbi:hypothetical protein EIP91_012202 [Steccherinum ochraceum]|uniref:O-methylsterigmatocystin oxidoreductase n=1 Tax=Steccherinum ochraceum TaxID=92696 RepID=A0A4V2MWU8_9APHY|nr:hypothetical protein EIP91_012202 [Steccherinum ochraceum]